MFAYSRDPPWLELKAGPFRLRRVGAIAVLDLGIFYIAKIGDSLFFRRGKS